MRKEQRRLTLSRFMHTESNLVGFCQLAPHWQKSVTVSADRTQDLNLLIGGASQSLDVAGFSMQAGIRMRRATYKMLLEKRAKTLPTCTYCWSAGRSPSRPQTNSFDRSCGGPPGRSRARVQELHGVPR